MPLKLVKRPGSNAWYVRGHVAGQSVFETTGTQSRALAEQFRVKREAALYEDRALGRRPSIPFSSAAEHFIEFQPRGLTTENAVDRLVDHFKLTGVAAIKQAQADEAAQALYPKGTAATKVRLAYTPITAILNFAAERDWCDPPKIRKPKLPKGKTRWITPTEAQRLIAGAAAHLKPLLLFILCTGARLSEAIELQWEDVNLAAGTAIFRDTKNGADRIAALPPAAIVSLANIPFTDAEKKTRAGAVFLTDQGQPYADRERVMGGQIRTAWATACKNAGLATPIKSRPITPSQSLKGRSDDRSRG